MVADPQSAFAAFLIVDVVDDDFRAEGGRPGEPEFRANPAANVAFAGGRDPVTS